MRFRRVLFIYPDYPNSHYGGKNAHPPLGIGVISELLEQNNIGTGLLDLGLHLPITLAYNRIKEFEPDLIAISAMTFRFKHHYALVDTLKSYIDMPIVMGGPHVSACKSKVLEQCKSLDFGVSLEGEYTMVELCNGKNLSEIKGLIYRDDNEIIFNGERDVIENLDTLPFPRYKKIDLSLYSKTRFICSSRGCAYSCIFCQSMSMLGRKSRFRSAKNLFDEIIFWYEKGHNEFNFVDDNFTLNKKRVFKLCEMIKKSNIKDLIFHVSGVRADQVNEEMLKLMREVGFAYLSFGVESASDDILKILKKNETIKDIEKSVLIAKKLGYYVKLYFLVGSPYETLEDVKKSIKFANKYASGGCNFASLMPLPGTELMEWVQKNGTLLMDEDYYLNEFAEFERIPYFDGPGMTIKEKQLALKLTERLRIGLSRKYRLRSLKKDFFIDNKNYGLPKAAILFVLRMLFISGLLYNLYERNRNFKKYCILIKEALRLNRYKFNAI